MKSISNVIYMKGKISTLSDYINTIESIIFCTQKVGQLDYLKLDEASLLYDHRYEERVRRRELNLLYLLDEVYFSKTSAPTGIVEDLDSLEKTMFSVSFYRDLTFLKPSFGAIRTVQSLCKRIRKHLNHAANNVTQEDYHKVASNMQYLCPPESKDSFLDQLRSLITEIEYKRDSLEEKFVNITNVG